MEADLELVVAGMIAVWWIFEISRRVYGLETAPIVVSWK